MINLICAIVWTFCFGLNYLTTKNTFKLEGNFKYLSLAMTVFSFICALVYWGLYLGALL